MYLYFFFFFLLEDGNGLGKILLKISTVYKNSCCQVSTVFLHLIVALKGIIQKVIFVSELQSSPVRQKSMSLSRMKSWLLGYTIELCYNLVIIRLFIKAVEHANQSWCFAFLSVLLNVNLCYGFSFFSCFTNPVKGKHLKMRWMKSCWLPLFGVFFAPGGSHL